MERYLPFGVEIKQTKQAEINQRKRLTMYDYYGLTYGQFDYKESEGCRTQKDKDRDNARLLILAGKNIPKDLEARLLQYKEEELENN